MTGSPLGRVDGGLGGERGDKVAVVWGWGAGLVVGKFTLEKELVDWPGLPRAEAPRTFSLSCLNLLGMVIEKRWDTSALLGEDNARDRKLILA
jgi:hypothetical protein